MILIIYTTILLIVLSIFLQKRFTFWSKQGIKGPSLWQLISGFLMPQHKYIERMSKLYGKVYGTYGLTNRVLVINDPDLIYEIMVKRFEDFPNRLDWNFGTSPIMLKDLAFIPGNSDWKRIRGSLSPSFSSSKLKSMMSHILEFSDKFVGDLDQKVGQHIDFKFFIEAFVMDSITASFIGVNVDTQNNPDNQIVVNVKNLFNIDANFSRIVSIIAPKIAKYLHLEFFDKNIIEFFDRLISKLINDKALNGCAGDEQDLLGQMMEMNKNEVVLDQVTEMDSKSNEKLNKKFLTKDEIKAEIVAFLIAGFETTSSTLIHISYFLSKYPLIQKKMYEELKNITDFSFEGLNQFKYLNAVINESLRLRPPILYIFRSAAKDNELSGIKIPAGTNINIHTYAVHRDPAFWAEPNEFNPDRFLSNYNPRAFLPFGAGPRICIGRKFAQYKILIFLVKLLKKFELTQSNEANLEYSTGSVTFLPKNLIIKLKNRK